MSQISSTEKDVTLNITVDKSVHINNSNVVAPFSNVQGNVSSVIGEQKQETDPDEEVVDKFVSEVVSGDVLRTFKRKDFYNQVFLFWCRQNEIKPVPLLKFYDIFEKHPFLIDCIEIVKRQTIYKVCVKM